MRKKIFVLFACLVCMQTVSAQSYYESETDIYNLGDSRSPYANVSTVTHELDFYIQDGWGLGYQLRRDYNKYIGWNIFGFSYMSGFDSPADYGRVNFKLLGVRAYTPAFKSIRGYVDLNMGYTLMYADLKEYHYGYWGGYWDDGIEVSHKFGLDFGIGVQLSKRFAVGYNLNFLTPDNIKSHWAKISFLF